MWKGIDGRQIGRMKRKGEKATWALNILPPYNSSQNIELHYADRRRGCATTKNE